MAKIIISLLLLIFSFSVKGIELQPYSGIVYSNKWGLQTGADIGFPLKNNFYFQTGLMLYSNPESTCSYDDWRIGVNLPVYM